jgi:hypothetical protein
MLQHIKSIVESFFNYLRYENRRWVILLVFITIISFVFKDSIHHIATKAKDPVKSQLEMSQRVNDKLSEVLEMADGSRVYIFQFHNGVTYYTGQHAQRFTCTYEIVGKGISREANNLQNLQVSIFSWWISEVLKGNMVYSDINEMSDYTTMITLKQQGIESVICYPIIHQGKVVGIIGIDYVNRPTNIVDNEEFREWFSGVSNNIGTILK